ncbi:MAG: hypothetical protein Q9157_005073 [Trypethelium eluteriae]
MNRFLTKRRAKESPTTENFPPELHARSLTPTLTRKGRKWKKNQPEPKIELDLSTALPSDDNFRTSLLMNGLSARFSMLREQDDPNSKLGKASDDSVLQPKRQSRLHEFGFMGSNLADIAEVSSINDSIRPPFAQRQGSFASGEGYGTDDESTHGSIMSRSRPGEGNVLFGGRQKVYKIPVASTNVPKPSRLRGKAVYEDDVSLSAFQKMRQREKEQQQEEELQRTSEDIEHIEGDGEKDTSYPPSISSFSYLKRQTSSSTASQPSIKTLSTAATSIASQGAGAIPPSGPIKSNQSAHGIERSLTKSKRLYDQGLNEHLYEQQAFALTRLDSIQKQRNPTPGRHTPPYLPQTRSASSLHDRFHRPGNQAGQATSPPPSASAYKLTTFGSARESKSPAGSPVMGFPNSPPLSPPPMSDSEDTPLTMSLNPADRGKATAMGAFNKPSQTFDEAQYLERQRRMLQGLDAPSSEQTLRRQYDDIPNESAAIEKGDNRSQSSPKDGRPEPGRPSSPPPPANQPVPVAGQDNRESLTLDTQRTFFGYIGSDSEDEPVTSPLEELSTPQPMDRTLRRPAPVDPIEQHPAFRSIDTTAREPDWDTGIQTSAVSDPVAIPRIDEEEVATIADEHTALKDLDSPTLGPDEAALSGLVRQHLRQGSGQSSIWGERTPAPVVPPLNAMPRIPRSRGVSRAGPESSYTHSNPWDLDEIDSAYFGEGDSLTSISPINGSRRRKHSAGSTVSKNNETRSPAHLEEQDNVPWQEVLKNKHTRGGSTETQQEREAFANELAQRQKAIQENMRTRAETESRAPSPFGSERLRMFGMLRAKSSRESIASKTEPSAKALKRLGISVNDSSTVSLTRNNTRHSEASGLEEQDDASIRGRRMPPINTQKGVEEMRRKWEAHAQRANERGRTASPQRATTYSQSSYGQSVRDRSNSELSSGRSRSRTGRYRDDEGLEPPIEEQAGRSPNLPQRFPIPLDLKQSQADALENPTPPSSAKLPIIHKAKSGYFDAQSLRPLQPVRPGDRSGPSSGASSPLLTTSSTLRQTQHGTSLPHSPPDSASSTPPPSNLPTPNSMAAPPFSRSQMPNRKRSVQKSEISEPVLISYTSNFDTVDLPPGASLKNGQEASSAPPVPPMNPLRRRTQKLFNTLGRSDSAPEVPHLPHPGTNQDPSRVSPQRANTLPDEDERSWSRQRNRKPSGYRSTRNHGVGSPQPPSPPNQFRPAIAQANMHTPDNGMF